MFTQRRGYFPLKPSCLSPRISFPPSPLLESKKSHLSKVELDPQFFPLGVPSKKRLFSPQASMLESRDFFSTQPPTWVQEKFFLPMGLLFPSSIIGYCDKIYLFHIHIPYVSSSYESIVHTYKFIQPIVYLNTQYNCMKHIRNMHDAHLILYFE